MGGIILSLLGLSAGNVSTLSVPTLPPLNLEDFVIVLARELASALSLLVRFDGAASDCAEFDVKGGKGEEGEGGGSEGKGLFTGGDIERAWAVDVDVADDLDGEDECER